MKKFIFAIFFGFVCWIIYEADRGATNLFMTFVRSIPNGDKLGHICIFGTMTFLANMALNGRVVLIHRLPLYLGSMLVLIFAFGEELTQLFVKTRTPDIGDALSDLIGVTLASLITWWVIQRTRNSVQAK